MGLMRDPDDNGHLIIDPETAPIIRRIFDLALDGFGNMKICRVLMILIGEPKKVDGVKTQEVRIVYNFVGEL